MNDNLEHVEASAMAPGGPWPAVWTEWGCTFFLPRAGANSSHPDNLPFYMERTVDDHRDVVFEAGIRTIAKRENHFIHIVDGSGDCPVSNENIIHTHYDLANNEGYWWEPETNVALVSDTISGDPLMQVGEPESSGEHRGLVDFTPRSPLQDTQDSVAAGNHIGPVDFTPRRDHVGDWQHSFNGRQDQEPSETVEEFAQHVQGDIVEAGLVNSTYEGSANVTFIEKDGIVTCLQNNPQLCLHAKPDRRYYVKLWLVDTGCGHDLVSLASVRELENMFKTGGSEVVFATANGSTPAQGRVKLQVPGLDEIINPYILADTPAVLSVGRRCRAEGYSFLWLNGYKPVFTKLLPNGKLAIICLDVIRDIPYLRPDAPTLTGARLQDTLACDYGVSVHRNKLAITNHPTSRPCGTCDDHMTHPAR